MIQLRKKRTDDSVITPVKIKKSAYPNIAGHDVLYKSVWKDNYLGTSYIDETVRYMVGGWSNGTDKDLEQRSDEARSAYIDQVNDCTILSTKSLILPNFMADILLNTSPVTLIARPKCLY